MKLSNLFLVLVCILGIHTIARAEEEGKESYFTLDKIEVYSDIHSLDEKNLTTLGVRTQVSLVRAAEKKAFYLKLGSSKIDAQVPINEEGKVEMARVSSASFTILEARTRKKNIRETAFLYDMHAGRFFYDKKILSGIIDRELGVDLFSIAPQIHIVIVKNVIRVYIKGSAAFGLGKTKYNKDISNTFNFLDRDSDPGYAYLAYGSEAGITIMERVDLTGFYNGKFYNVTEAHDDGLGGNQYGRNEFEEKSFGGQLAVRISPKVSIGGHFNITEYQNNFSEDKTIWSLGVPSVVTDQSRDNLEKAVSGGIFIRGEF